MGDSSTNGARGVRIVIPSPQSAEEQIEVWVDSGIVGKLSSIRATHQLFALYYNVLGQLPPVNNAGYHEKDDQEADNSRGILDAHAVFQGLNRPHIEEDGDKSVYIYIVKPKYTYEYVPDMATTCRRKLAPEGAVFAVYVKLNEEGTGGEIFNWEFVKCDPQDQSLPEDHENRYDERRW